MAKNEKQEWITTKIPKDIADEIEILIKNRKLGYNSKTSFVSDALREKIVQLSRKEKKLSPDEIIEMKKVFAKFYSSEDPEPGLEDKMIEMNNEIIMIKKMLIEKLYPTAEQQNPTMLEERMQKDKTFARYAPMIELIVKEKDRLVLMDHKKERIAEVAVQKGELFCQLCEEKNCVHIGFVFSLPDVYEILTSRGIKHSIQKKEMN
mgnify:CR=1 FL=1